MHYIEINGERHSLPYPEEERLVDGNYIVILLRVPPKVIFNSNIFVYNIKGDFLWQVNKEIIEKYQTFEDCPFVDAVFNERQELILFNWDGWKVTVNPRTGKELSYEFTK